MPVRTASGGRAADAILLRLMRKYMEHFAGLWRHAMSGSAAIVGVRELRATCRLAHSVHRSERQGRDCQEEPSAMRPATHCVLKP